QGAAVAEVGGETASGRIPLLLCAPPGGEISSQVDGQEEPDAQEKILEKTTEAGLGEQGDGAAGGYGTGGSHSSEPTSEPPAVAELAAGDEALAAATEPAGFPAATTSEPPAEPSFLSSADVAAVRIALQANRRCQLALHDLLAAVEAREGQARELLRRVRTVAGFETRARKAAKRVIGGLGGGAGWGIRDEPGVRGAAAAAEAAGGAGGAGGAGAGVSGMAGGGGGEGGGRVYGGHAAEMLLVNWAKPRHKRGRKHKYSSLGFDPDPHDCSNLEASSRDMPVNEDQGVFERLRGVMPLVFRGRKWGKGEVGALREGVEQQVVTGMIQEAVRERPKLTFDRSMLQRTIAEIKSRQLTPEAMRAAVARVDWSTVAAAFVNPANRSLGRGLHLRRTALECKLRWLNVDDPSITWGEWSEREEEILKEVAESRGLCGWEGIAEEVNRRVREEEEGEDVEWEEGGEGVGRENDGERRAGGQGVGRQRGGGGGGKGGGEGKASEKGGKRRRRTALQCLMGYQKWWNPHVARRHWSAEEDRQLTAAVRRHGEVNWAAVALAVEGRSGRECLQRLRGRERTDFSDAGR
ncbi:unnamed protein product, partial [Closterium sp. NIES-53]